MNEIYTIQRLLASETLNPETIHALEIAIKCIHIVGMEIQVAEIQKEIIRKKGCEEI